MFVEAWGEDVRGKEWRWGIMANGQKVSLWSDKNILKLEYEDCGTAL